MGNAKNKKVPKKRKAKKSNLSTTSSDQKENRPKSKVTKRDPDDTISMSKQLLKKISNNQTKRRSTSQNELRICGNGKPLPSLADLEKMYEDSDGDEPPTSPKTGMPQEMCSTPTPKILTPPVISENKLLSPTTINKISERMMDFISNITNPIELLEDVPPPPVVPPKKRKKPDVPYIVGCKDRPKVESRPNTNFCKGDDDYGVEASSEDPNDSPPTKRAKKSKIPTYSKSIFNAKTDEIVARLTNNDTGGIREGSSDSNKTIEYDPRLFKTQRPHTFSPLPSTSRDNDTFIKNDELFNESLREKYINIITTPKAEENDILITDIPFDTIIIDDVSEVDRIPEIKSNCNVNGQNDIDLTKPIKIDNDEDCIIIQSPTEKINQENLNQPIVIDDEYSEINLLNDNYDTDTIEIIDLDVDDVIAQNKSIIDKFKNNNMVTLNKINSVVVVPTTHKNPTASEPAASSTPLKDMQIQNVSEITNSNTNIPNSRLESEEAIKKVITDFFNCYQNITRNREKRHSRKYGLFQNDINTTKQRSNSNEIIPLPIHMLQNVDNRMQTDDDMTVIVDVGIPSSITVEQKTKNIPTDSTPKPDPPETPRNFGECPICLDPLSSKGIASTTCGHVFCLKCIKASFKMTGKRCPTCRKLLKGAGGGYHQLFL